MKDTKISNLLAKYLSGNASEKEKKEVEAWRKEVGNEMIFNEMQDLWHLSAAGKESFSPDTEKAWQKFSGIIKEEPLKPGNKKLFYIVAAAASILPFIVFILLFPSDPVTNKQENIISLNTEAVQGIENNGEEIIADSAIVNIPENAIANVVIATDSVVEFYLPDSTRVWLNKKSKFSYPEKFSDGNRIVNLEGEAFFDVKRDPSRPFIIYTPTSLTRVLGTSFNLKAYKGQEVELSVVSGTVEFASVLNPEKTKLTLTVNDKAHLKNNTITSEKTKNLNKEIVWKKHPKSKTRLKRFLNKIKNIFKKQGKENSEND